MMRRWIVFLFVTVFCASSCQQQDVAVTSLQSEEYASEITLDDALSSLFSFLDGTKCGYVPQIESIECHYSESLLTKGLTPQKDAYILNFVDNSGFAVLGANTSIPRIICVVDNAHIDADDLSIDIKNGQESAMSYDSDNIPEDFEWYCSDDDDYYSMSSKTTIVSDLIKNVLRVRTDDGEETSGLGNITIPFTTKQPLVSYKWNQGPWGEESVWNKYCCKNRNGSRLNVHAGCSVTACATVIAYNEYPQQMKANNQVIDLVSIKNQSEPEYLNDDQRESIRLLFGSVFNSVDRYFAWEEGTCITAFQIKKHLIRCGYSNVQMLKSSSFTVDMISATSEMLAMNKPVIISVLSSIKMGHTWVISGARYDVDGNYKLYCNWGWSGYCDGYFDTDCFKPTDSNYSVHNRLITYDIPSDNKSVEFYF